MLGKPATVTHKFFIFIFWNMCTSYHYDGTFDRDWKRPEAVPQRVNAAATVTQPVTDRILRTLARDDEHRAPVGITRQTIDQLRATLDQIHSGELPVG